VTNHGLTNEQINRQYAIADALFELPLEEKLKYLSNTAAGDFRGYKPRSTGELSSRDNDERYNIPKFTKEHEREHPQLIKDYYEEIKEFSLVCFLLAGLPMRDIGTDINCFLQF
jgi:isopenicillin N synthase-like dioxygenase